MERQAKNYLYERNIPQLFESLMTGLMYHKPEDPIAFLQSCLEEAKKKGGQYAWDSFVTPAKTKSRAVFAQNKPLPPIGVTDGERRKEKEGKEEGGEKRTGGDGVEKKREGGEGRQQEDGSARNSGEVGQKAEDSGHAGGAEKEDEVKDHTKPETGPELQSLASKPLIFVLGGPGSGKGTQCAKIVEEFHLTHLSAGDLLREEVARGSPQGQSIQEIMREGKLVPPEVTITLLKAAMLSRPEAVGFLIDGFPRELSQAEIFESQVCKCSLVLMFECSEDVMVERLQRRGETSGRVDDNEETIRKRLHTFTESTLPVIQRYQSLGKVKLVNADHSVDEVYHEVQETMQQLLASQP